MLTSQGSGSNTADNQYQHLQCFTPSRNTSTYVCISYLQQPFEVGAIFVSISTSSYIILFSEIKCFFTLKQKPVSGLVAFKQNMVQNHGLFPIYNIVKNGVAGAPLLHSLEIMSEFFSEEYLLNNLIQKEIAAGIATQRTRLISSIICNEYKQSG